MATLTVRNLDDTIARALHVRATEHGRSAEAEHREIFRAALSGDHRPSPRMAATARLSEFRRRTAGRGSASTADLLEESRNERTARSSDDPAS